MTASDLTLLDIADRLLETGVSLTGEATISVADVDLVYLGLDLVLASVERVRGREGPLLVPGVRASDALARELPGRRPGEGPGAMSADVHATEEDIRDEVARLRADLPDRVDIDPNDVERGLAKLVLTIVEFVRQLLERQAIRRMEAGSLTDGEVERVGTALMRLDEKLGEMAGRFGLAREDLRLGLGPLGQLV
jgi:hypothetical protein